MISARNVRPVHLRVAGLGCALLLSGCLHSVYEKPLFAGGEGVEVVLMEQPCNRLDGVDEGVDAAQLVLSRVDGLGRLVATDKAWEQRARQLAVEMDAQRALVKPCEGEGLVGFEFAQIELWRTGVERPAVVDEPPAPEGTLQPPPHTRYGERLGILLDCLTQPGGDTAPFSATERARLDGLEARAYFSSDPHFTGYAKLDPYFRPAQESGLSLSMIVSARDRADREAARYRAGSTAQRTRYAEQYLLCLMERGYAR
ncbi:hypothetical protein [Aestuariirhabdus litorea]|uniref:Uncharacterized protein n=1 Tax=Aestuariirhabdus litorea TaxID=2528527 RepID=A0A3P3VKC6_9GAMM|nr:hypothetical protein [Aestuariirhabdus litorea]RRJ82767.1 hypothetical protein D0544_13000 [Aestuariirhabdus litorea]RWW92927.1 hypothetical protein DZC74_12975 [Endozoicomonadaceae bacterium GTF-13]